MVGYRWRCQACQAGNEPNLDKCAFCGCPANAGSEDIEKHINPDAFKKKKAKEEYSKSLFIYFFIPFFAANHALNGRYESLVIILAIVAFISVKNINLLIHIWNDRWARMTLITIASIFMVSILYRRVFMLDDSPHVWLLALSYLVLSPLSYYYFFKSENGERVFGDYYSKYKK